MDCCHVQKLSRFEDFRNALKDADKHLASGTECDSAIFKEALGVLADALRKGCPSCRRRVQYVLHVAFGWPTQAPIQILFLETWLEQIREKERVH